MKYYSYKELLETSLYSYIYDVERYLFDNIQYKYYNLTVLLENLYNILYLIIRESNISQNNFELIVSNYPDLIEYIPRNVRKLV